ncbi:MAG: DRTGG domain-containing protein [Candidatus Hodarchaeales archaeon]|jgi:BioD-like phosphotransacetylase family protein
MEKVVIASIGKDAGKTSLIIGLSKALNKKIGYLKPFGDRLLYQKKRLWDYDSALVTNVLGLEQSPEDITIGFVHSKLRFMYDEVSTKEKLTEITNNVSKNKDIVFIEGGENLSYGRSVYLDPLTVARSTGARLLLIVSGPNEAIIDDITFLAKCLNTDNVDLIGVIVNKVKDVENFKNLYLDTFNELGMKILGIIPNRKELTYFSMDFLCQTLLAKVLSGEKGLQNKVEHILVGAMSAAQVTKNPLWSLKNKLIITPGDRPDMIIAALESSTAGIVLTNNILPSDPIIESKANMANIPLLLTSTDTFTTAKQIDDMDITFTKDETEKIDLLEKLVKEHVDLSAF